MFKTAKAKLVVFIYDEDDDEGEGNVAESAAVDVALGGNRAAGLNCGINGVDVVVVVDDADGGDADAVGVTLLARVAGGIEFVRFYLFCDNIYYLKIEQVVLLSSIVTGGGGSAAFGVGAASRFAALLLLLFDCLLTADPTRALIS